ncbi:MAG: hypothetical protein M3N56_12370, partial [Actinomycetota bacterium]|nr:hypothetical protein [Actinomycetota bacterium]
VALGGEVERLPSGPRMRASRSTSAVVQASAVLGGRGNGDVEILSDALAAVRQDGDPAMVT